MSIFDVKCQDRAIGMLQLGLQNARLAHAQILYGPAGVGKSLAANEFAKLLLCADRQQKTAETSHNASSWQDSCGRCDSCRLMAAGTHPDYHLIYKELISLIPGKERHKARDIGIDVIRQEVLEKVGLRANLSDYKVFVILEAQRLSRSAQNALLKTLEEPPGGTYIILITEQLSALLATIRSRAAVVPFGLVDESLFRSRLAEAGADKRHQQFFSRFVPGQLGVALELFQLGVYDLNMRLGSDLADLAPSRADDMAQWVLEESKGLAGRIREVWDQRGGAVASESEANRLALSRVIAIVGEHYRDALKCSVGLADKWLTNSDEVTCVKRIADRHDVAELQEKINQVRRTQTYLDDNVNQTLLVTELFVELAG